MKFQAVTAVASIVGVAVAAPAQRTETEGKSLLSRAADRFCGRCYEPCGVAAVGVPAIPAYGGGLFARGEQKGQNKQKTQAASGRCSFCRHLSIGAPRCGAYAGVAGYTTGVAVAAPAYAPIATYAAYAPPPVAAYAPPPVAAYAPPPVATYAAAAYAPAPVATYAANYAVEAVAAPVPVATYAPVPTYVAAAPAVAAPIAAAPAIPEPVVAAPAYAAPIATYAAAPAYPVPAYPPPPAYGNYYNDRRPNYAYSQGGRSDSDASVVNDIEVVA
ncbi:hypothetical protein HIM_08645 [Hirsutella minnesotensis 3608]|uniref:Uncharacterized protein n=1 Tax=Hirsutella minnesotensis 3608 TaxID=1043627 RepID=A0A0F7ZMD5_9HYPO|nr:hypothetical protein HIM_08645 [Hirsutella minnesotensis 3608]